MFLSAAKKRLCAERKKNTAGASISWQPALYDRHWNLEVYNQTHQSKEGGCGCMTRSLGDFKCGECYRWGQSDGDVTSTFLKSWELFNLKLSEQPNKKGGGLWKKDAGRCTFSLGTRFLLIGNNGKKILLLAKKHHVDTGHKIIYKPCCEQFNEGSIFFLPNYTHSPHHCTEGGLAYSWTRLGWVLTLASLVG